MENNRTIYDIISLYEFVAISGLSIFSIGNENLYTLGLLSMLIGKQIPEKLIKKVILNPNNSLNIRPSDAINCNMINQGGFAEKNPGFPSGHSTVAFMLLTIFLYEYIVNYKNNIKNSNLQLKIPVIIILLFLLAIAVPYSRYKSDCHTPIQVISGCVLGIIIGLFYTMVIDKMWLSKYPKYINDKNIFYGLWFY
jgi:membrane-associated phospholipid phosphatase